MFSLQCTQVSDTRCQELQAVRLKLHAMHTAAVLQLRSLVGRDGHTCSKEGTKDSPREKPTGSASYVVQHQSPSPGNEGEGMAMDHFWDQVGCRHGWEGSWLMSLQSHCHLSKVMATKGGS